MPAYRDDFNNWGYEAKPLHGVWATAPYLHNGSVPSLYQLLLPPAQRMKTFYVGRLSFDPVNVGRQTDARFVRLGERPVSDSGAKYGVDHSAVVILRNCDRVQLRGNTINSPGPYTKEAISLDKTVTQAVGANDGIVVKRGVETPVIRKRDDT